MARREDQHDRAADPERLVRRRVEPRAARGRRAAAPLLRPGAGAVPHALRAGARARRVLSPPRRAPRPGGRVMGETLRCPFHGWQYDGTTGECVAHPVLRAHPARGARARVGRAGDATAWSSSGTTPRASRPTWDFPRMPEIGHPDWSEPRTFELEVPRAHAGHAREQQRPGALPVRARHDRDAAVDDPLQRGRPHYPHRAARASSVTPLGTFRDRRSCATRGGSGSPPCAASASPTRACSMYSSTTPIDETHMHSRWLLTVDATTSSTSRARSS